MGATRRHVAKTPYRSRSVAAVSLAFKLIRSIPSTDFPPNIALPLTSKGWKYAVRGARAGVLRFLFASVLCASPAWSAHRVAKSNPVPVPDSVPRCDDPAVSDLILKEFSGRFWASGFGAAGIGGRREVVVRNDYWPQAEMPRRFCEGVIKPLGSSERPDCKYISPRSSPVCYPIYYAIIENGPGYQVEWCAVGLDRPWYADPRCRLARP